MDCLILPLGLCGSSWGLPPRSAASEGATQAPTNPTPAVRRTERRLNNAFFFMAGLLLFHDRNTTDGQPSTTSWAQNRPSVKSGCQGSWTDQSALNLRRDFRFSRIGLDLSQ